MMQDYANSKDKMDDNFYDRFIYNLAQMNYEECYRLIDLAGLQKEQSKGLRALLCFDMLYYEIGHITHSDANRESLVRELSKEIREALSSSEAINEELLVIIDIKQHSGSLYKELLDIDFTVPDSFFVRYNDFLNTLSALQIYELIPYKETLVFEISAVKSLLQAHTYLSKFEYMNTILALTEAHSQIQQWEKVFVFKKYSPHNFNNSKSEYNFLYKFILRIQHSLIAKASLYFDKTLAMVDNRDLFEFGNEFITRIQAKSAELGIHYIGLLLHTRDVESYRNWKEGGYKFSRKAATFEAPLENFVEVFKHTYKPEEVPDEVEAEMTKVLETELYNIAQAKFRPVKMVQNSLDVCFLFFKIEHNVYLAAHYAYVSMRRESERNSILEFFNSLSLQLKMLTTAGIER